jgi:adenylate cyclase
MSERIGILYLDDEEQNLLSFQALFRREYDVFTTQSAEEAVQVLNEHPSTSFFPTRRCPA